MCKTSDLNFEALSKIWNIQKRLKSPLSGAFFCLRFVAHAIPPVGHGIHAPRFEIFEEISISHSSFTKTNRFHR
ncbi:hypothetical protein D3C76_527230 [compost metagenome]